MTNIFAQISIFLEEKKKFEAEREKLERDNERLKKIESDFKDSATKMNKSNNKGKNLQVNLFFQFVRVKAA